MTITAHAQTRADLDVADRLLRSCWDNFKATEPTFVLRDLIAIELAKVREAERELILDAVSRVCTSDQCDAVNAEIKALR